jgi:hypothetical protein
MSNIKVMTIEDAKGLMSTGCPFCEDMIKRAKKARMNVKIEMDVASFERFHIVDITKEAPREA